MKRMKDKLKDKHMVQWMNLHQINRSVAWLWGSLASVKSSESEIQSLHGMSSMLWGDEWETCL